MKLSPPLVSILLSWALGLAACGSDEAVSGAGAADQDGAPKSGPAPKPATKPAKDAGGSAADAAVPESDAACSFPATECRAPVLRNEEAFGSLPVGGEDATTPTGGDFVFDTSLCPSAAGFGSCERVLQVAGPSACVCSARSLVVYDARIVGDSALVLKVQTDVVIAGTLDLAARGGLGGPGTAPGVATTDLAPLRGGAAGNDVLVAGAVGAYGGGGGGALQVGAGGGITITSSGVVQVGGGGGGHPAGAVWNGIGADGGAGGSILLQAATVVVSGALLANGGGGGGGGSSRGPSEPGQDAAVAGRDVAAGGVADDGYGCPLDGYTEGGHGGAGAAQGRAAGSGESGDTANCFVDDYVLKGGNGGPTGRIRIDTFGGVGLSATSGFVSPTASVGVLGVAR